MKTCSKCGISKPESEYYSDGNGSLRGECKSCKTRIELEKGKQRRQLFKEWKSSLSCQRCGYSDSRALQFHHTDNNKEANIANRVAVWSLDKIKKEASKCEVLCANCHQIEHYKPL